MWLRFLTFPLALIGGLLVAALCAAGLVFALAYPNLPSLDTLTDYQPKVPLRVYPAEGELIGEFGEERRVLVDIKDVSPALTNAIIAAEDERFYQHAGIDYIGVARAAYANLLTGGRRQGASTIPMQVGRNFFLSSEKTLTRKLYEVLLAIKIEHSLTKEQILGLYVNQIYLGQRAYGFASAAHAYFRKPIDKLTLAEGAVLAALPKAPPPPRSSPARSRKPTGCAPNTSPRWCARRCTSSIPKTPTAAAFASIPPCARPIRRRRPRRCATGLWNTIGVSGP